MRSESSMMELSGRKRKDMRREIFLSLQYSLVHGRIDFFLCHY